MIMSWKLLSYKVKLDNQGMFTSIYDKENDREVVQEGHRANLLRMYEDKPIYFDNWDIDIYYTEKFWDVDQVERMEWTELGPVRAVLSMTRKASNSVIDQEIIFYAKSRRIEFVTHVDWKEHQTLLKVHFPVAVHTDEATFDVQFGNLTRKTHQNTSWTWPALRAAARSGWTSPRDITECLCSTTVSTAIP